MPGELNRTGRLRRPLLLLAVVFALSLVTSVGIGSVRISPIELIRMLLAAMPGLGQQVATTWPDSHWAIIWRIRLPRVVLASLVGSSLAVAGATFQGLFRNPMADPFVIGVSSGAAVGAVIAMLLGLQSALFGLGAVPLFAFAGGVLAILVVYSLSRTRGGVPVATLLLSGIAVSSFLSAVVSVLVFFSQEKVGPIVFWLMGGMSGSDWTRVKLLLPYTGIGLVILLAYAREINLLLLGEESAQQLGVEVTRTKLHLLISGAVLTAASVSVTGIIGFVGLVTPHVIRLVWGPDYRLLMPASALGGAVLLVLADALARTVVAPGELPVGVITSLLGAPFFLYLLHRKRKELF